MALTKTLYFYMLLLIMLPLYCIAQYTQWLTGSLTMPRSDTQQAVGYDEYNNTIYLLGGLQNQQQLIAFHLNNNSEIISVQDIGRMYLDQDNPQIRAQQYGQLNNILYMVEYNAIDIMWLTTTNMEYNYLSLPTATDNPCIISFSNQHDYLMIIGGFTNGYSNMVQMLNISDESWLIYSGVSLPTLNQGREDAACTTINQKMYIIQGYGDLGYLSSIEVLDILDISNMTQASWEYFPQNLPYGAIRSRAVAYNTEIITIGGYYYDNGDHWPTSIHVIDTLSGTVSVVANLSYGVMSPAVIMIYPFIYAFGGRGIGFTDVDTWQYHEITTSVPSESPSKVPSGSPTFEPTYNPATQPTNAPSYAPSISPTHCDDYEEISNKGRNEYQYGDEIVNVRRYRNKFNKEHITQFITNSSNNYVLQYVECYDNDCIIECNERAGCLLANISLYYDQNSTIYRVLILCSEQASCIFSTISATSWWLNVDIVIICNGIDSCGGMTIYADWFRSINILCLQIGACDNMEIYLDPPLNFTNYNISMNESYDHGIVHCVVPNSCDDLLIETTSNYSRLAMYEHSNRVIFSNGIGYLSDLNNIVCNNNRFIKYQSWTPETEETILESIQNEYISNEYFPCQGVQVRCNMLNTSSNCTMDYSINSAKITELQAANTAECYWVNVQEIQSVFCDGQCIASPTESPTPSPTDSPTTPSKSPSLYPTIEPTEDPTEDPTADPTFDPTYDPTSDPTADPTSNPITAKPTADPTLDPTQQPTDNPSATPTGAPSNAPSGSPTPAPSRAPTISNAYDYYVETVYNLRGLTDIDISKMAENVKNTTNDIRIIIESGYVNHNAGIAWELNYYDFTLLIEKVNGEIIDDIADNERPGSILADNADDMVLTSQIQGSQFICNYIIAKYDQNEFEETVTTKLQKYFHSLADGVTNANAAEISFDVETMSESAQLLNPPKKEEIAYVFYSLAAITSIIAMLGVFALIWNKISIKFGKNIVDDAKWLSVIIFALQFWDFSSDINLLIEIWNRDDLSIDINILIIAVGCGFFIVLPYIANILIAAKVKNIIKDNEAAKSWFQANTTFFCILVVLTGGCYAALALVSSNIFGLAKFSTGLTKYELRHLSKIKVFGTVILENIPQLIIQALYAVRIGGITQAVEVAFIASILSVTASTLSYLIDRDTDETKVAQYYITIQRKKKQNSSNDIYQGLKIKTHLRNKTLQSLYPISKASDNSEMTTSTEEHITEAERRYIMKNRGRIQALGESLSALCQIQPKSIEIGSTLIHKNGAIVHVVHYVYKSELEIMQSELAEMGENVIVTANYYTQQLHTSLSKEMTHLFLYHFELNERDFEVGYYDLIGIKRMNVTRYFNLDNKSSVYDDKKTGSNSPNHGLIPKMESEVMLDQDGSDNYCLENKLEIAINMYFRNGDGEYDVKKSKTLEIVERVNNNVDEMDNIQEITAEMMEVLQRKDDDKGDDESESKSITNNEEDDGLQNQLAQVDSIRL